MKYKCDVPKSVGYKNCGALGISYCEEWKLYENFKLWAMSNGYQDNLTLERIDKTKNFGPDNCRWSTMLKQMNNYKRNKYVTCPKTGRTKTITDWSKELGIDVSTFSYRLRNMSIEKVFGMQYYVRCKVNLSPHRLRKSWSKLLAKTLKIESCNYKNYGAKCITVCDQWKEYSNFEHWAYDNGYNETLILCRKDVFKNYCPENCYWGTRKDMNKNKSNIVKIYYDGCTYTQKDLAEKLGISVCALSRRLLLNKPVEQIFHVGKITSKKELEKTK
jgi:hypothetical protein